jgi:3-dehydroquinate synthetase
MSARMSMAHVSAGVRIKTLLAKAGLPVEARGIQVKQLLEAHYRDKKFIGERNRFVMLRAIGTALVQENIPPDIVRESLKTILNT